MFKKIKGMLRGHLLKDTYLELDNDTDRTIQILSLAILLEREVNVWSHAHGEYFKAQFIQQSGDWNEVTGPVVIAATILSRHCQLLKISNDEIMEKLSMLTVLPDNGKERLEPYYSLAELAYDRGIRINGKASKVRCLTASIDDGDLSIVLI
jgi:hypothetical protein